MNRRPIPFLYHAGVWSHIQTKYAANARLGETEKEIVFFILFGLLVLFFNLLLRQFSQTRKLSTAVSGNKVCGDDAYDCFCRLVMGWKTIEAHEFPIVGERQKQTNKQQQQKDTIRIAVDHGLMTCIQR